MEGPPVFCTCLVLLLTLFDCVLGDHEYMVSKSEPITLSNGFETKLTCEMNIYPDKFQWKYYPSRDPYDSKENIDLNESRYVLIPEYRYETKSEKHNKSRKKSALTIAADNDTHVAGDYQCLAYYGAYVVASVPWRITLSRLEDFEEQESINITVTEGNTVSWYCKTPVSNPEAYIDYYNGDKHVEPPFLKPRIKSLLLQSVTVSDSGVYKCTATNMQKITSRASLNLRVVRSTMPTGPRFIIKPKEFYTVTKGSTVFLECAAVGNPVPKATWLKKNGVLPTHRTEMVPGGLKIKNISSTDDGVYVCNYTNNWGTISHHITVIYNEEPSIDCYPNRTEAKQGEESELSCVVKGTPEPRVNWFLNGFSVNNDSSIEAIGSKIYIKPIEKRHAGNLQIFARNSVKTVNSSIYLSVIPRSTVDMSASTQNPTKHTTRRKNTRKPKHGKGQTSQMTPPKKPTISRLSDESVMVRWSVPENHGLPIQFFKVQYRELGPAGLNEHHRNKGSRWKTANEDIAPNINNYEIGNLKPEYIYKFRIAAVYSNNDNKLSNNSDKFHLKRLDFNERNPLPIPLIIRTETINRTAVRIYWKYTPKPDINVDGFYISYMLSSEAGDYMRERVDGTNLKFYTLSHLQPDTYYDIKLQSFNSKMAGDFSPIMKARTAARNVSAIVPTNAPTNIVTPNNESSNKMYIFIGIVVVLVALLVSTVGLLFVCRKWKQNKNLDENKTAVDEHHIQADGNDYVVSQKNLPRSNGCALPSNRITITANPLADADNKNQNMIEMSCMASQNNNTTPTNDDQPASSVNKKQSKRSKNVDSKTSGENYV